MLAHLALLTGLYVLTARRYRTTMQQCAAGFAHTSECEMGRALFLRIVATVFLFIKIVGNLL